MVDYFGTLWRDDVLNPKPLLTRELLKRAQKSELGYEVICQDIFDDLKRLFFC